MELLFGIILGLLILVLLVVVHELGHAIAARRNGVVVEEFGIGFPPRAWAKKLRNGVHFSLNWLPLGGFVKLQGEHDAADKKGDYGAATYWQKTKILLAGVVINWLVAAGILTVLAWVGLPKILPNQFSIPGDTTITRQPVEITFVAKNSPAEKAGLKAGDKVVRFAGEPIPTSDALAKQTKTHKGEAVEIIYSSKCVESSVKVKLRDSQNTQGFLGVGSGQREQIQSSWSAPIVGVVTTAQFTGVTLYGLGEVVVNLFKGLVLQINLNPEIRTIGQENLQAVGGSVAGPIGILGTIFPAAEQAGPVQLAFLTAIISLTLAVMNILPIPALDGGRWFVTTLYKLRGKKLTKEREESIQATGFMILMVLVVLVTIADVGKIIK
jgi:regulator of sigma E protease